MTFAKPSPQAQRAFRWLGGASSLLFVCACLLPVKPQSHSALDDSWMEALHSAFLHHLQFGRDIVYTYGPWGFLYGGYRPETHLLSTLTWLGLGIVFWAAGRRIAQASFANEISRWLWLMAVAALTALLTFPSTDARVMCWPALLIALHFFDEEPRGQFVRSALIVSLGLLSLVKFTTFIASGVVVATVAIDCIWRRRRFPSSAVLYSGSFLFFWLLARQNLSSLVPYLKSSLQITSGYTEAMSAYQAGEAKYIAWFVIVALWALGMALFAFRRRLHSFALLPVASLGFLMFVLFKHGFVRDDVHEAAAAVLLLFVVLVCFAIFWPEVESKRWLQGLGCVCVLTAGAFASFSFQRCGEPLLAKQLAETVRPEKWLAPFQLLRNGSEWKIARENILAASRDSFSLPPIEGDIDFYSPNLMPIFANGLTYQPRPMFQSFSAFTPHLARLNAGWLRGDHAADTILFDGATIDRRYPALDDGLSWPELLTRYDVQQVEIPFVVLKRSKAPREFHLTLLQEVSLKLGEPFSMPSNSGPIWAEIEIDRTLTGSLVSALFKPPVLVLNTTLRNGQQHTSRLIPEMARSGFVLSPYVTDARSFAELASDRPEPELLERELASMSISAVPASSENNHFKSPMLVRLYRLDYPRQNLENVAGYQQVAQLKQDLSHAELNGAGQLIYLRDAGSVLAPSAGTTVLLDPPQNSNRLRIGYGVQLSNDREYTGGATFAAFALDAQQKATLLWSRHVDLHAPGDRRMQETILELGDVATRRIVLQATPDSNGANAMLRPYWSRMHFE